MLRVAQTNNSWNAVAASDWEKTLNRIIKETELLEQELASGSSGNPETARKTSGSYYTPEDVADHFWLLFFRFHKIKSAADIRGLIKDADFVEPSAGSGIFLFTFFRQVLRFGLDVSELGNIKFHVVDINFSALKYINQKLREIESTLSCKLDHIGPVQCDFIDWAKDIKFNSVIFVGNPPYVSNLVGAKWRNLYADFVETMLTNVAKSRSFSLILPISICFSKQYSKLRNIIKQTGMGISIASYDNIPNALFKSGKPESSNSNKSNSQRCVIIHVGGPNRGLLEATKLQRWTASDRKVFLHSVPNYESFSNYTFDDQFPRFVDSRIANYLSGSHKFTVRSLISKSSLPSYSVANVARNFIGIREFCPMSSGTTPIQAVSHEANLILLQIFSSPIFFDYWQSLGDGFHVTKRNIFDFPISQKLMEQCKSNLSDANRLWHNRVKYQKSKLNCGKLINTYDFSKEFSNISI